MSHLNESISALKSLSLSETVFTIINFVLTRMFYPKARLIRFPFILRGRYFAQFGKGFTTGYFCRVECYKVNKDITPELRIGLNYKIGDYVHIAVGE